MYVVLIYYSHNQILEVSDIFIGYISYLYIMILSCILLVVHGCMLNFYVFF